MAWTLFGRNWLTGIICMWHGLLVDIPNGWALCDGTNGTPDLRERFVRGAPANTNPGQENGNTTHAHTVSGSSYQTRDLHYHWVAGETEGPEEDSDDAAWEDGSWVPYDYHTHDFELNTDMGGNYHYHLIDLWTTSVNHLPPYYDIAFIMKL